ncbi:T9SS type B sorting domain-containing protein [Sphingobacterium faecale]|uniref:Gliding motility-associated C-terminal domain-containing protein n=1 Tax=Sphingobacterium faecale TaxID=2803775 RepID=A0ABS1RBY6_9SPHI|nr:gliding motility-associated C-terminal domain-containing protein [Sphingobacterium faecale]MBL1411356.1 gliding motility-associated C-terminal domain-containing protein [Sphingobacterium faecale]
MKWLSFFVLTMGISLNAFCQAVDKKVFILDEIREISESEALIIDSDTLIFGPNAELSVFGILEVKSSYIIFAPSARLEGTGKMLIMPPTNSDKGDMQTPTWIDGNGNYSVNIKIEVYNPGGIELGRLTHESLDEEKSISNNFYSGANFSLMDDGICIALNGNCFTLGFDAILENSSPNRMVISGNNVNSIFSKKVRGNTIYSFSIGLKKGDYSPIVVEPEIDAELFVSVFTESGVNGSLSFPKKAGGLGRIWGVHADHNVRTSYVFEHSTGDTEGGIASEDMEIYQFSDTKEWHLTTTEYLGAEKHQTKNLASMRAGAAKNYFSKFGKVRNGPQSADDYIAVKKGQSALISILANDKGGDGKLLLEKTQIVEQPINGTVTLSSTGEAEYQPTAGFIGSDLFVYEVVDEFGLVSRSTVYIAVEGEGIFTLSNVVTPNGDGYNDKLVFVSEEQFMSLELTIVNRWGDRLYHNSSYDNSWDGAGLSGGTYYYVMKAKRHKGDVVNQKGWILLTK